MGRKKIFSQTGTYLEVKFFNRSCSLIKVILYFYEHISFFFRVPELLFQPSMIGLEQAGIAETVDYVFKKFSPEDQNTLAQVCI